MLLQYPVLSSFKRMQNAAAFKAGIKNRLRGAFYGATAVFPLWGGVGTHPPPISALSGSEAVFRLILTVFPDAGQGGGLYE